MNVTKTYFPPIEDYISYLRKIWANGWITNHGPLVIELEKKLKKFLGVKHLFLVSNGTIALEIALKALDISEEIITTPFSYVATISSIAWINCKPVFVDIDPDSLCINPSLIAEKVTNKTEAILATHVYGSPCNLEYLENIVQKYNLKLIYDASHCFGVKYKGESILNYGDISTLSFHATKLFHMAEGGAVITNDDDIAHKISYLRNFGHRGQEDFWGLGINGKNSELHAAMGLCVLPNIMSIICYRKKASLEYDKCLKDTKLEHIKINNDTEYNYSYYPVIFESEEQLLKTRCALNDNNIYPRRYFYPSLDKLNYINKYEVPVADNISKRIMCLPLYHCLSITDVKNISKIIISSLV
ncbi:MAG: DegT/DnrJ/EryC1/StrS family aminotransferase [Ignavibacteriae bacterium]|nr:MAG: DegT/DnrJ/EryC1/StrS family aminotransferase [Ignavibacteriota bacterium]